MNKQILLNVWNEIKADSLHGSVFVPNNGRFGYYFQFHQSVNSLEVFYIPNAWIPEIPGSTPNKYLDYTVISL